MTSAHLKGEDVEYVQRFKYKPSTTDKRLSVTYRQAATVCITRLCYSYIQMRVCVCVIFTFGI